MNKYIFILGFVLLNQIVLGYCSEANTDKQQTEIIVITNRVYSQTSNTFSFQNKIDTTGQLSFFNVNKLNDNNLLVSLTDSIVFVSKVLSTNSNWVLFVHGDSKTFEQAVLRGFKIQETHNVNVIVFSWPSKEFGINGSRNFKLSKRHVEQSNKHFETLLIFFKNIKREHSFFWEEKKLTLFVHSLGNYFLELFAKNSSLSQSLPLLFNNVVMNAAAVNQKNHTFWLEKLHIQNNIFVISNRHDFNLKGVRIFTYSGKQLGEVIKPPFFENAYYVNFSKAVGFRFPTGITHTYFIGTIPEKSEYIKRFYTEMLHGNIPDFQNFDIFTLRKNNSGFNIKFN